MSGKKVRLGQYYTPEAVAEWIVSLARSPRDARVLEPSCGPGAFLDALLGRGFENIEALEIDGRSVSVARKLFSPRVSIQEGDFLLAPRRADYDLLAGNPPYVRWGNMSSQTKKILETDPFWSQYSSGEWDLLYAFLIGGAEMLRPGGEMIYVVPYNWFSATYAQPVRRYLLENGHFSDIIHFGEYKLFPDAAPNAIVFRWEKSPSKSKIAVVDFLGRTGQTETIINRIENLRQGLAGGQEERDEEWHSFRADQFSSDAPWSLASSTDAAFCKKVESRATLRLEEVADVGVGMVSGYDRAFLLEDTRGWSAAEKKFVFPFVKARNCQHFAVSQPSRFIWADAIATEAELRSYPNLYQHLLGHKQELLGRYGEKQWWHWATVRNESLFRRNLRKPKIFLPCVDRSTRARFSITQKPYWGSGDVLLLAAKKDIDPWLLQAWLGSALFNRWYEIRGPQTGQRRRYTQSFLRTVPVLPESAISPHARKKLIANSKALATNPQSKAELLEANEKLLENLFRTQ